ncbi:MAG: transposase, partial [Akkermansiaceae bacterium]|nr:transposase [Akkermansiaceae bacterium]
IDEIIKLDGEETKVKYSKPLRRIAVYRPYDASRRPRSRKDGEEEQPEDERRSQVIELITNNMEWDAGVVSKLYLARWEIETFFKFIKQRLNITTFLGTSENAVRTQIWVAMIAALLLVYLKKLCGKNWTTSGLASSVRANLMSTYDLYA